MNQQWLIDHVLATGDSIPTAPSNDGVYLSLTQAESIVDQTLDALGAHGDPVEYTYMRGHRKRLIHTLTMIPKADESRRSLLDVGCYGYMGLWASAHLGYERVVGIEWHPDVDQPIIKRNLTVNGEHVNFESHNFDISLASWPIDELFDTVLFFEVLEHINQDPMGVMQRISALMRDDATLVMSVPNAISYKALREFLVGMPPWTYWFFEPDLEHEPRHCFEYTPIVFQSLLIAAGMKPEAFRTIFAYSSPEQEQETLGVAETMGFTGSDLGETMIAQVRKVRGEVPLRYPDVLYSPDGYYKNIYPRLQSVLRDRLRTHKDRQNRLLPGSLIETKLTQDEDSPDRLQDLLQVCDQQLQRQEELETQLDDARSQIENVVRDRDAHQSWAGELQAERTALETQVNELLFQTDCRLQNEQRLAQQVQQSDAKRERAEAELVEVKTWAEQASVENAQLRAQVNELLFACDCYLQQLNDPSHCVRVIRQRRFRWALDRTKSVARKTPVVRTTMRPVYRATKRFIKRHI